MEKLAVSKATKFLFKVSSRDIYEFPDTNDHAHMLLQDSTAMDTFPIVLIGKGWKAEEKDSIFISSIARDFIGEQRNIICIMKISDTEFMIYSYTKKHDGDMPHTVTEPVHSTASISWDRGPASTIRIGNPLIRGKGSQELSRLNI